MTAWKWSPVGGLAIWAAWKLLSWGAFPWETSAQGGALLNLLILLGLALGGAFVAMRQEAETPDFVTALREVGKAPLRFALLVTAGMAVWYGTVAEEGVAARREKMRTEAQALVEDDAQWEAFIAAQGAGAWDREAALAQQLETIDTVFNPLLFLGLALLGLVLAGMVFSVVATVLWRSVWTR
jgi:hypothetical protein